MISKEREYLNRIRDVLKERRIALSLKQSLAAEKAGIKVRTLQHFEQTGNISLLNLLKLLVLYRMDTKAVAGIEDRGQWALEELERAETVKRVR